MDDLEQLLLSREPTDDERVLIRGVLEVLQPLDITVLMEASPLGAIGVRRLLGLLARHAPAAHGASA